MSELFNFISHASTQIPIDIQNFENLQGSTVTTDFNLGFTNWLGNILSIIMVVALLILLGMLIYGALGWLTSQGDSSKLEAARNRMVHAVIGILILASTLAIFMFVQYLLGLNVFTAGSGAPSAPSSGTGFMEWYGERSTGGEETDTGTRPGGGSSRGSESGEDSGEVRTFIPR